MVVKFGGESIRLGSWHRLRNGASIKQALRHPRNNGHGNDTMAMVAAAIAAVDHRNRHAARVVAIAVIGDDTFELTPEPRARAPFYHGLL